MTNRPEVALVVLDNLSYASVVGRETVEALGVPIVLGDIAKSEDVKRAGKGVDVIVNFAAQTHNDNSIADPDIFFGTNVLGTLELVKYAATNGVRFHQISTDEVFGDLPIGSKEKFTEESPYRPSSPYSASKAAADHIVRAWARTYGLKATISNCSNNYGPRQHPEKLIPKTIQLLSTGKSPIVYGTGENVRDWIHVEDHVAGVWAVLDRGVIGSTYLLGANQERSNLDVVSEICGIFGKSINDVSFVQDRAGHDLRYAIDFSFVQETLGWTANQRSMRDTLTQMVLNWKPLA